jgi:hypothetical protein
MGATVKPPSVVGRIFWRSADRKRGRPYEASAITLYSSEARWKPRCAVAAS